MSRMKRVRRPRGGTGGIAPSRESGAEARRRVGRVGRRRRAKLRIGKGEEIAGGRCGKSLDRGKKEPGSRKRDHGGALRHAAADRTLGGSPAAGAVHRRRAAALVLQRLRQPARREESRQERDDEKRPQFHWIEKSTSRSSSRNRARRISRESRSVPSSASCRRGACPRPPWSRSSRGPRRTSRPETRRR